MLIMINELEQTIAGYEKGLSRGNLSKEERAIQRDCIRRLKRDVEKGKEQYKRASAVLIKGKIGALKK